MTIHKWYCPSCSARLDPYALCPRAACRAARLVEINATAGPPTADPETQRILLADPTVPQRILLADPTVHKSIAKSATYGKEYSYGSEYDEKIVRLARLERQAREIGAFPTDPRDPCSPLNPNNVREMDMRSAYPKVEPYPAWEGAIHWAEGPGPHTVPGGGTIKLRGVTQIPLDLGELIVVAPCLVRLRVSLFVGNLLRLDDLPLPLGTPQAPQAIPDGQGDKRDAVLLATLCHLAVDTRIHVPYPGTVITVRLYNTGVFKQPVTVDVTGKAWPAPPACTCEYGDGPCAVHAPTDEEVIQQWRTR